jgi:hypothetical protein
VVVLSRPVSFVRNEFQTADISDLAVMRAVCRHLVKRKRQLCGFFVSVFVLSEWWMCQLEVWRLLSPQPPFPPPPTPFSPRITSAANGGDFVSPVCNRRGPGMTWIWLVLDVLSAYSYDESVTTLTLRKASLWLRFVCFPWGSRNGRRFTFLSSINRLFCVMENATLTSGLLFTCRRP